MEIALKIICVLMFLLSIGVGIAAHRLKFRNMELNLAYMIYGVSSVLGFYYMSWWIVIIGYVLVLIIKRIYRTQY